jgi:hypothetical protein
MGRPFSSFRDFIRCCFGFFPRLNLVPGTFAQPRQWLGLRLFGIIDRRKTCRAQQRIRQRAILRAQPCHFAFQQPDVPPLQQSLNEIPHARLFSVQ